MNNFEYFWNRARFGQTFCCYFHSKRFLCILLLYPGVYFKNIFEKIKSLTIGCYLFFTIISHRTMRQLYVCGYIFIFVVKYTTVVKDFLSLLGALKICCFQCHCTITFSRSHHIPIKGEVEEPFIYHLMGSYT